MFTSFVHPECMQKLFNFLYVKSITNIISIHLLVFALLKSLL